MRPSCALSSAGSTSCRRGSRGQSADRCERRCAAPVSRLSFRNMGTQPKLTSRDLELMPDNGKLYELIDGELYVSKQPSWEHQYTCVQIVSALNAWSKQSGL